MTTEYETTLERAGKLLLDSWEHKEKRMLSLSLMPENFEEIELSVFIPGEVTFQTGIGFDVEHLIEWE